MSVYNDIIYFPVHITGSDKVSCIHVASNREESFDDEQSNVSNVSKSLIEDPTKNLHTDLLKQDSKNKMKVSNTAEKVEPTETKVIENSSQDVNQHPSHSSTNIATFESKMVQADSDRNVKFGRKDTTYLVSAMITAEIDDEEKQSFPKIKDLCTLIPLKAIEQLNKDLEVSKISKRKKKNMFQAPTNTSHTQSISNEMNNFAFINGPMAEGFTNELSVKGLSNQKSKKKERKKSKRNHDEQSFPTIQPLLSLGKFDDINESLDNNSNYKNGPNFVIRYHQGSLIYEVNGKQLENSNSDSNEIKTNVEKKVYYKSGKYDEYLKRVEEVAEENNHIHKLGFPNLQYAIRKELDQALQRDHCLGIVDKLDPKLKMYHQNSFKNKESNEKTKLEQPSSGRETEAIIEMNCDGTNAENIETMHTQEGN